MNWRQGKHGAHYLIRDSIVVAEAFSRPSGWEYWDFTTEASAGPFATLEEAQAAAEAATAPAPA